jgi:hypothetical protein
MYVSAEEEAEVGRAHSRYIISRVKLYGPEARLNATLD